MTEDSFGTFLISYVPTGLTLHCPRHFFGCRTDKVLRSQRRIWSLVLLRSRWLQEFLVCIWRKRIKEILHTKRPNVLISTSGGESKRNTPSPFIAHLLAVWWAGSPFSVLCFGKITPDLYSEWIDIIPEWNYISHGSKFAKSLNCQNVQHAGGKASVTWPHERQQSLYHTISQVAPIQFYELKKEDVIEACTVYLKTVDRFTTKIEKALFRL